MNYENPAQVKFQEHSYYIYILYLYLYLLSNLQGHNVNTAFFCYFYDVSKNELQSHCDLQDYYIGNNQ